MFEAVSSGMMLKYVGLTALIGTIVSCWSQVKSALSQIIGLFIVTYHIPHQDLKDGVVCYLRSNCKYLPVSTYDLNADFLFHKLFNNKAMVAYERSFSSHSNDLKCQIYYNKWNVYLVQESGSTPFAMFTFRFLFDKDKFFNKILDNMNVKLFSNERTRFYVDNVFGSLEFGTKGVDKTNKSDEACIATDGSCNQHIEKRIQQGVYKLIGYNLDDILFTSGYEEKYINYLAYPKEIYDAIEELKQWKNSKTWYRERGIPWKRGWFLYGKHGCGKSSLIRAVAEELDMPIYIFHLITMTNTDLVKEWSRMIANTPCIALLEDLDNVFNKRENLNKNTFQSVLSFDTLLNVIDGVDKNEGIFTVITTNRPELIDEALCSISEESSGISSRPGRIDRTIHLKELDQDCRRKIVARILKEHPEYHEKLVNEGKHDTGAQFNERCIQLALKMYWEKPNDNTNKLIDATDLKSKNLIAFKNAKTSMEEIDELIAANDF